MLTSSEAMPQSPDPFLEQADIVAFLREAVPDLAAAYVFGSAANGQLRNDSDVDVAVLGKSALSAQERWGIQERLAVRLGCDVDLVDLRDASTVMQKQVVSTGRVLYDRDRTERARFEMYVYSSCALLNEERSAILDDVRKRGRVYGG